MRFRIFFRALLIIFALGTSCYQIGTFIALGLSSAPPESELKPAFGAFAHFFTLIICVWFIIYQFKLIHKEEGV